MSGAGVQVAGPGEADDADPPQRQRRHAERRQGEAALEKPATGGRRLEGSDQLLGAQAVQGLVAKRLQAQAEPVEHRTVLGIGLAPLLERQALLGAGMAGLQQRHPLRRFVEDAFSPSLAHSASTW